MYKISLIKLNSIDQCTLIMNSRVVQLLPNIQFLVNLNINAFNIYIFKFQVNI